MKDYYSILGVSQNASADEIKKAYRRLIRKYHPDRNPGDKEAEEMSKEINSAYEVLSDPQKKNLYDQGVDPLSSSSNQGFGQGFGGFASGSGFFDMFDMFGGSGFNQSHQKKSRIMRGQDVGVEQKISLEQALFGDTITINFNSIIQCNSCHGKGTTDDVRKEINCSECNGSGHISHVHNTMIGQIVQESECNHCQGYGTIIEHACLDCSGYGITKGRDSVEFELPPGCHNGQRLQLQSKGGYGVHGGSRGDLVVQIRISKHSVYSISGNNLNCKLSVPVSAALLGQKIEIETLDGKKSVQIPIGSTTGQHITLKGLGFPKATGAIDNRGDLEIFIDIILPQKLNAKQKKAVEDLAKVLHDDSYKYALESVEKGGFAKWFAKLFR